MNTADPAGAVHLAWKPAPGATAYRFFMRDVESGEVVVRATVPAPAFVVPAGFFAAGRSYLWKVDVVRGNESVNWIYNIPLLPPVSSVHAGHYRWDPPAGAAPLLYRFVIRDESADTIHQRAMITTNEFVVDWSKLDPAHIYRYRVQYQHEGQWLNLSGYQGLAPPFREPGLTAVDAAAEAPPVARPVSKPVIPLAASAPHIIATARAERPSAGPRDRSETDPRLLFLFTIDTEASLRKMSDPDRATAVDHQIFCRIGRKEYGITLLMDMLERCRMRGTFFIDILQEYQFGAEPQQRAIDAILRRGHDIQLHLHPSPNLRFAGDPALRSLVLATRHNDPQLFRRVLEHSIELFERRVGRRPVAFRNGSYHICDAFLPIMAECGLTLDSSIYAFKNCRTSPWPRARTLPFRVGGLVEVPVNWLVYQSGSEQKIIQYAMKRQELATQHCLAQLAGRPGLSTLVYMAHSYTLLKERRTGDAAARARWNAKLATLCTQEAYANMYIDDDTEMAFLEGVDNDRIDILSRILRFTAGLPGVRAVTFQDLHDTYRDRLGVSPQPVDPIPVFDADQRRAALLGTRRYSLSYLRQVEGELAQSAMAAGAAAAKEGAPAHAAAAPAAAM